MNIYPYVYRIDHPSGEFYIGYRAANQVPGEADFGHIYKTSSKHLSYPFEEYTQTILAEFYLSSGKDDAYDFEQAFIYENLENPMMVNKRCYYGSKRRFSMSGKTLTVETKAKMSEAKRGKARKPFSEETRRKLSEANRGKTLSDEVRQMRIGRKLSAETKLKISESNQGKTRSDEAKKKISEARKKRTRHK